MRYKLRYTQLYYLHPISLISALLDLYNILQLYMLSSYIASSTVCKVSGDFKFQDFHTEHKMMSTNLAFRQLALCKSVCICLAESCPLLFMQICTTKLVELKLAMLDTGRIQTHLINFIYLSRLYSTSAEGLQDSRSYSLLKMLSLGQYV